jgi:hypothetical protein
MRSTRWLAGGAIALSALLAAGCSGSTGAGSAAGAPGSSALAKSLLTALKGATSVHISGATAEGGQAVHLDLSMTRAGGMSGTMAVGPGPVTILATGGKVYLKLTADALKTMHLPASACALVCHKYLQLSQADARGFTGGMGWSTLLNPASFSGRNRADGKVSGPVTVNGQSAWAVRAKDGSTGYVAARGPAYLLRVTPPRGQGNGQINFTQWNSVTIPPAPPASQVVTLSQLAA